MAEHRTRQRRKQTFAAAALALALVVWAVVAARAQEVARPNLITPGNAQPIQLYADGITTWLEGGRRVFVLQGQVWIEQGLVSMRMPQAVVWIDEAGRQATGVYGVDVFGDGNVTIDNGPQRQTPEAALVQLATRGEVRIKAYGGPVQEQTATKEPVYQRAQAAKASVAPAASEPGSAKGSSVTTQASLSLASVPEVSGIQQVQALQPGPSVLPVPGVPGPTVPGPTVPGPTVPGPTVPTPPGAAPKTNGPVPPFGDPNAPTRRFAIRPRTALGISASTFADGGNTAYVIPTGVIITVGDPGDPKGFLDIEADRMVLWTKGNPQQIFTNMQSSQGETSNSLEFYLSGNVEIRTLTGAKAGTSSGPPQSETLRADEVYYDVGRNVAIALRSDLEMRNPKVPNPIHFQADEFFRLNAQLYQTNQTQVFSTILPSDPGLKVEVRQATIEERDTQKKTLFGVPYTKSATGEPIDQKEHYFKGRDMVVRLEGVPVFYFPWIQGNVEDPLGPFTGLSFGYNRIFGFHIYTTWDVFELLGYERPANTRWHLLVDYLSARGPALGTEFQTAGKDLFGIDNKFESRVLAWGINDHGQDVLGGSRGTEAFISPTVAVPVTHPEWRGRFFGNLNLQELPYGFSVQTQLALISDRNFLEQYYVPDFQNDPNQESFLYVKQQVDRWAWTVLAEPRLRSWVTETEWLPRADGYLIGQKMFDWFTYNMHASAGYGMLRPAEGPTFPYSVTDAPVNTGRLDVIQDISLPFQAGPFKLVPYGVLDLTYYSQDIDGNSQGRVYGGGGMRASIPFSKLYPCVDSELFNLNGIYHKIVLSSNWYLAGSNVRYTDLPQLDRFNDDTTDQALRDIFPRQPTLNPANAAFLTSSPLFTPQDYALRRLIMSRIDTLDQIDVVQLDLRQRWQTKRGLPGSEHIIDWMTLDLGVSLFPQSNRDNFGEPLGVLEYDWLWNIGDRTALVSNGWFETINGGPKVWNGGVVLNRPDNTNFYLGYRQIDPLQSKAVVASITYAFSAKYAMTASTVWDFGVDNQNYTIMVTRIGTDLRMSFGVSYSSVVNTFGVQFEIVPNLVGSSKHNAFNPAMLGNNMASGHH